MAPLYDNAVFFFCCCYIYQYDFAKLPSGRHPESRWRSRSEINGIIAVLAGVLAYGGVHLIGLTADMR